LTFIVVVVQNGEKPAQKLLFPFVHAFSIQLIKLAAILTFRHVPTQLK